VINHSGASSKATQNEFWLAEAEPLKTADPNYFHQLLSSPALLHSAFSVTLLTEIYPLTLYEYSQSSYPMDYVVANLHKQTNKKKTY
jgi:hypothetical protein